MRKSNYGLGEILLNIFNLLLTFFFYSRARLIRFPIIVRGKKYIDFGTKLTTGYGCRIEVNGVFDNKRLVFGNCVNIGDYVRISCSDRIVIGDNVLMGSRVTIIDNSHGNYRENCDVPWVPPNERRISVRSVVIGNNVWIGEGVVVQSGVSIGEGSIIGANSVVTRDIPMKSIAVGAPARVIKTWNDEIKVWSDVR